MRQTRLLVVPFIMIIVLSISVVAYWTLSESTEIIRQGITRHYRLILDETARDIRQRLHQADDTAKLMVRMPSVRALFNESPGSEPFTNALAVFSDFMHAALQMNRELSNIVLFDMNGQQLVNPRPHEDLMPADRTGPGAPHPAFLAAALSGQPDRGARAHAGGVKPVLYVSMPVQKDDGTVTGALYVSVIIDDLITQWTDRLDAKTRTYMALLDHQRRVVTTTNPTLAVGEPYATTTSRADLLQTDHELFDDNMPGKRIGMHYRLPDLDLDLLMSADSAQVYAASKHLFMRTVMYAALGGGTAIAIGLMMYFSLLRKWRTTTRALETLVDTAGIATWKWIGYGFRSLLDPKIRLA